MPKKETLNGRVSYRLTADELKDIQRLTGGNISADEWCRQAAREKLAAIRTQGKQTVGSSGRPVIDRMNAEAEEAKRALHERHPVAQPAPAASPAPLSAQSMGLIMNQNQAIFEEVLRLKFMLRQLATRHVQKNLDHRMWENIELGSEGNIFREVAVKWAERYGMKIKY